MRTVRRYDLTYPALSYECIDMPEGAEVLCAKLSRGGPTIWALLDPKLPKVQRTFKVVQTTEDLTDENLRHLGTIEYFEGLVVNHIFEVLGGDEECEKK